MRNYITKKDVTKVKDILYNFQSFKMHLLVEIL
jgi:hypothetical protein